ncbi:MAG: hypothetical protein HS113_10740 [Verrucomicrobiales bacterium]|nr:hypothetical protein [Verrucomicrobiales bacterium]
MKNLRSLGTAVLLAFGLAGASGWAADGGNGNGGDQGGNGNGGDAEPGKPTVEPGKPTVGPGKPEKPVLPTEIKDLIDRFQAEQRARVQEMKQLAREAQGAALEKRAQVREQLRDQLRQMLLEQKEKREQLREQLRERLEQLMREQPDRRDVIDVAREQLREQKKHSKDE